MCLRTCTCNPFTNPAHLFFGGGLLSFGESQFIFSTTTVPAYLLICPIHQIHYTYFVALCSVLGSPNMYLPNQCACVHAHVNHSLNPLYLFCGAVFCLGRPNLYLQHNHCVYGPAHVSHSQNPVYLFCGAVLGLGESHFIFATPLCLHACPCAPFPKSIMRIL